MIHIQKMAPGPPTMMAPQAPTMLPVPTWAAMAVESAWNDVMPPPWLPPRREKSPNTRRQPSPKQPELDRLGAHGEPDAHAEQQDDQDVVGQVVVDGGNDTK